MADINGQTADPAFVRQLVENAFFARTQLLESLLDPRRDVERECGYPSVNTSVSLEIYQQLYEREAVAARVVEVWPKECWQQCPYVYEDEDSDTVTEFEQDWDGLGKGLRGERSYHGQEEGSVIWDYLRRLDELSGIGSFGVLLFGIDDGKDLREPAYLPDFADSTASILSQMGTDAQYFTTTVVPRSFNGTTRPAAQARRRLLFLRAFPESLVQISQYESDPRSPRFGQPLLYQITLNDPRDLQSGVGLSLATVHVHWTRILHVADNYHCTSSSDIFAPPRMRPVLNNLLGLRKLYAGSPEMYWKGAFPGLSIETHPTLGGTPDIDYVSIRDSVMSYMNGLQRALALAGVTAKSLAPQVVDPTPMINAQVEAVCIKLNIPKRIFCGSERGELSSSEDKDSWNERKMARNKDYTTPHLIVPFVDRCINLGVLPVPQSGGYLIEWPALDKQSEDEKAKVALTRTQAYVQYTGGNVDQWFPPLDFLTREMRYSEEEAQAILDNAKAQIEDEDALVIRSDLRPANPEAGIIALLKKRSEGLITDETLKSILMLLFQISEQRAEEIMIDPAYEAKAEEERQASLAALNPSAKEENVKDEVGDEIKDESPNLTKE